MTSMTQRRGSGGSVESSVIHRCRRFTLRRQASADGKVVLKTACNAAQRARASELLRHEYAALQELSQAGVPGVVRPLALSGPEDALTLVLEDAGPEDLRQRLAAGPLPVGDFLDLALQLTVACASLHANNVVHRAISPAHAVLGDGGRSTLVHFTGAAGLTGVARAAEIEKASALAWVSPEQTGRMNRLVDWRSDLYSLGATFYAMLVGAPPFRSSDPLELVHAHLAQMPVPAAVADPRAPQVLSDIVQKLLAKMPEQRYQSADALAADLREARSRWLAHGTIEPFELGRLDLVRELPLVERLYGREQEITTLRRALARVSTGRAELVLVAGEAGIGKTALVGTLRDEAVAQGARIASGKFDLRAANVPYAPITEALLALTRSLLSDPEERRAEELGRLRDAVKADGRVLTDLVPELRGLFGDLPEVCALGPVEAEYRLHRTLQAFVRAVATRRHPLVIFLDDLQWADAASLRVLRALAADLESRHVLLLGALRPREIGPEHPFQRTLGEIERAGTAVTRVEIKPLGVDTIIAFLSDALRCEPERARSLAELVVYKTAGNPLFIRQLLRSLQRDGLLVFDATTGTCSWDLRRIERVGITENVGALMATAIRKLSIDAQEILEIAACVGKRVELRSVAAVWGRTVDETTARLGEVLREGLLVPDDERGPHDELGFRFVHDRVQQAAYALLSEDRREALHLQIGRHLLGLPQREPDEWLFDAVDQLNLGLGAEGAARRPGASNVQLGLGAEGAASAAAEERVELAQLNHRAGLRARRAAAYGSALAYFQTGLALLPCDAWRSYHDLCFSLHRDAAEAALLAGEHALSRALVADGLPHATAMADAADLHAVRITSAAVTGEYESAVLWGREALRAFFGVEWQNASFDQEIAAQREAIDALLGGRAPEALIDLPLMESPEERVFMKIVSVMLSPAWSADRKLFRLLTMSGVRLTLEHGSSSESILPYAVFAQILIDLGEREAAQGFSQLAIALARRFEDRLQETRAFQLYNNFVRAWSTPLPLCAAGASQVFAMALQVGELHHAAYGRTMMVIYAFIAGIELDRILVDLEEGLSFCRRVGNEGMALFLLVYRQAIRCLMGLTRGRNSRDDELDEPALRSVAKDDPAAACLYDTVRLQTSYLFGDLAEARARSDAAARSLEFLAGFIPLAEHELFTALTLLSLGDGATGEERRALLERAAAAQQKLRVWEEGCAENFGHRRLLVDAEVARVEGRFLDAAELYDRSIEAATRAGSLLGAALGNERCGRLYLALGRTRVVEVYMRAARDGYVRWGASAKARALDDEFALGGGVDERGLADARSAGAELDTLSLLKAAETISSEIRLDRLLGRLMEVCIQAAGADRGVLVFEEEGGPFVRAVGRAGEPMSSERTPLAASPDVPREVIEHVRRTREVLVLDDVARNRKFASDLYVARRDVKSILVLPIQRQAVLLGTFFFQNDLTTHAFARERVRMLELLSVQIAIALENSVLFEKLKVEVEERTRAEGTVRFLADASAVFVESLESPTTLQRLTRLLVPALADWCMIDVVERDGQIRRVAGAHADAEKARVLRDQQESGGPTWPATSVLTSGAPILLPEISEAVLQADACGAEDAWLVRELGSRSLMAVPLLVHARRLGAITLGRSAPVRPYGPSDLALAEELARRAAMAVANACLYREAQDAICVRDDFLCVASHELRTPMTSMNLTLQALLRKFDRSIEDGVARGLHRMERQVRRLNQLVDDLLDVSRIHAGQLNLQIEEVELSAVVEDIIERFENAIAGSRSQVHVRVEAPVVGLWDRSRLDQVVANLLDNAIKFGAGRPIEITIARRGETARLAVKDHGIGIPPERLPHVFDRFERAVSTKHYGGLGLGLFIVRRIVEALHGTAHVESALGSGTTFTVELPCESARQAQPLRD